MIQFSMLPRLALRLGLLGNRKFGDDSKPGLGDPSLLIQQARSASRQVYQDLLQSLPEHSNHFAEESPELILQSGLADGADQFLVEEAFALPETYGSELVLQGIFPFPAAHYPNSRDFADPAKAEALAARARQIIRLDGDYAENDEPTSRRRNHHRAYRSQADFLIHHSDLLLAVWDPRAQAKGGGTEESVRKALAASIPVIAIHPGPDEVVIRLLQSENDLEHPERGRDWQPALAQVISALLAFPTDDKKGDAAAHCRAFLENTAPRVTAERQWAARKILPWLSRSLPGHPAPVGQPSPEPPDSLWQEYQHRASHLSGLHTNEYRGAFVLSYLLAILAVIFATCGILAFHFHSVPWGIALAVAKLLTIGWLLRNRKLAHQRQWQERGADLRFLAEILRPMPWLSAIGTHTPFSRLPPQYAAYDPRNTWMHWLFRALLRSQPILRPTVSAPPADFTYSDSHVTQTCRQLADHWVGDQLHYHRRTAHKMESLFERIEGWNTRFLQLIIAAVVIHLVGDLGYLGKKALTAPPGWFQETIHLLHLVAPLLLLLAAVLPAAMAGLTGLLYQHDARRHAERYRAMSKELANARRQLLLLADDPTARHPHGCHAWEAASLARQCAQIMIDEAADWQVAYRLDEVKAG